MKADNERQLHASHLLIAIRTGTLLVAPPPPSTGAVPDYLCVVVVELLVQLLHLHLLATQRRRHLLTARLPRGHLTLQQRAVLLHVQLRLLQLLQQPSREAQRSFTASTRSSCLL